MRLTMTHVVVVTMTTVFLLVAFDRGGALRKDRHLRTPEAPVAAAPPVVPEAATGKPPPHNDKVEDLPEGKGRDTTFDTCTACHGVALIKAQGLTRDLWDASIDLMLEKHRMPPVKPAERAEILDYLVEQFPPRRRPRGGDNPFLKQ